MYVIGTAGHVDHGKSLLVEALTGIDPDRLREEKTRGMTIDLGFAWLTLPDGRTVSIVDVPGHERFIKNMLAGAGGIDLALLVVAADDGVMPQTREHLAILNLLDVRHGVVAITKCDLVDEGWLDLVTADVRELLAGSTLEGSPVVPCSSVTRSGLDDLLRVLESALDGLPAKRDIGRPRLPIDRVFTIDGFGTIVTGTLIDGEFGLGEEVEVVPGGQRGRIRGLRSHRDQVERALPGTRTAVNISGIAKQDLRRGAVLARPGTLRDVTSVDVRLRAVEVLRHPLRHNLAVTFHSGADEANAQLRLLDADELSGGESAWAQIKLDTAVAVTRGDRFVLRTANDTVAGGVIADLNPRRHRRRDPQVAAALGAMLSDTPEDRLLDLLSRHPLAERAWLAAELAMTEQQISDAIAALMQGDLVLAIGSALVTSSYAHDLARRASELMTAYHAEHPLRPGMPVEEFRARLRLDAPDLARLSPLLTGVELRGAIARLHDFSAAPDPAQRAAIELFLAGLRAAPFDPPAARGLDLALIAYLVETGVVVQAGDGIVFDTGAFAEIERRVREHIGEHGQITLGQTRDLLGTSRKYAQALLEHLDRIRVTRRVGDDRVLR